MASNIKIATAARNAMLDVLTAQIGSSGKLKIYDGTQPTNPQTAISGPVLLATLSLSATAAPGASGGVLTFNAITQANAAQTGTATWYSVTKADDTRIIEGSVGASNSDLNLNTASIVSGGPVSVSSFAYTGPGA
jgi:hypothetical protein